MKKRALQVGINDYLVLNSLACARQDAEAFAETLQTRCGFSANDITLMTCTSEGGIGFAATERPPRALSLFLLVRLTRTS